ncbi:MAG: hypothetical protein JWM04_1381, partial [Verrucomicrobiales bacterium]|nr:hypothetical protein [Verrucomicrobiales bacterium]
MQNKMSLSFINGISRPPLYWLVGADDLTGAMDAGAQFVKAGLSTVVCLKPRVGDIPNAQVIVFNSDSRQMGADRALTAVESAMRQFGNASFYFKKTDSTLRGNIGIEMELFMTVAGVRQLVFVPAYPKAERFTRNGVHFVGDTPVAQTSFGKDPLNPVNSSSIHEFFSKKDTNVQLVSKPYLFSMGSKPTIFVPDCGSQDEMLAIAKACRDQKICAFGGSAGFAEAVLSVYENPLEQNQEPGLTSPCLLVNGSLNPVSLAQMKRLESKQRLIRIPSSLLDIKEVGVFVSRLTRATKSYDSLLLCSVLDEEEVSSYLSFGATLGLDAHEVHRRMAEVTALLVKGLLEANAFSSLVISGGATFAA